MFFDCWFSDSLAAFHFKTSTTWCLYWVSESSAQFNEFHFLICQLSPGRHSVQADSGGGKLAGLCGGCLTGCNTSSKLVRTGTAGQASESTQIQVMLLLLTRLQMKVLMQPDGAAEPAAPEVNHCCMMAVASAAGSKLILRPSAVMRGGNRIPGVRWSAAGGAAAGSGADGGWSGLTVAVACFPPTSFACNGQQVNKYEQVTGLRLLIGFKCCGTEDTTTPAAPATARTCAGPPQAHDGLLLGLPCSEIAMTVNAFEAVCWFSGVTSQRSGTDNA